jgi:hypothetical protein
VLDRIGEEAKNFGKRAFLVTDKDILQTGYTERIQRLLRDVNIDVKIFSDVAPNPRINPSRTDQNRPGNSKLICSSVLEVAVSSTLQKPSV